MIFIVLVVSGGGMLGWLEKLEVFIIPGTNSRVQKFNEQCETVKINHDKINVH